MLFFYKLYPHPPQPPRQWLTNYPILPGKFFTIFYIEESVPDSSHRPLLAPSVGISLRLESCQKWWANIYFSTSSPVVSRLEPDKRPAVTGASRVDHTSIIRQNLRPVVTRVGKTRFFSSRCIGFMVSMQKTPDFCK